MNVLTAALGFGIFFGFIELIKNRRQSDPEITRKSVHILAGLAVATLPWLMNFNQIQLLALLFIPILLISKKLNLLSSIHQVKRKTYGEIFFPIAVFLTAWLFPDRILFAYGVAVMSLSDGLAGLIGQRFGRKTYRLTATKSYIGSATFLVSAFVIGLVLIPQVISSLSVAILVSFALAAVLAALEGASTLGFDNLLLPLAGAGLLQLAVTKFG